MNRIKLGFLADSAPPLIDEWAVDTDVANGDMAVHESPRPYAIGNKSRHSVFLPVHLENRYRYPLLIWLHGDGQNASQLSQVMPRISDRNYIGVSIRGTRQCYRRRIYMESNACGNRKYFPSGPANDLFGTKKLQHRYEARFYRRF